MKSSKGPRLVAKESKQDKVVSPAQSPSNVPNARIQKFGYIADIVVSNAEPGPQIFHYVIQHEGSAEIIHWGQELSLQRALESVEQYLEQFNDSKRA
jgi:hypothetical protein